MKTLKYDGGEKELKIHYSNWDKQMAFMTFDECYELRKAVAYLLTFKEFEDLELIPRNFSIQISNKEINIFIILYIGFELEEYEFAKSTQNYHIVSFEKVLNEIIEFEKIKDEIKFMSNEMIASTVEALTENKLINALNSFRQLSNV